MSNRQLVIFEEVTPTLLPVAYFEGHLADLISHLKLPIYGGYNDLDEMNFAFLTLPSGSTVVVGEYSNAPRIGVDLYVDSKQVNIPVVVYESCQQLGKSRNQVVWFSEKFQSEIDQLFMEQGDIQEIDKSTEVGIEEVVYNPIACFQHSLRIYDRIEFPEYWAMLQYNLGTAYYQAFKSGDGNRGRNLKWAIDHYEQSEEIYTQDKYQERWKISQDTFKLVKKLSSEDLCGADLIGANLSGTSLNRANLHKANLSSADLSGADLSEAILSGAIFSEARLYKTDFKNSNVMGAKFTYAYGISLELREDLKQRGAIFDDRPPVDSRSILSSRS
jgi:Pentapeptide repeats (8 copies)